MAIYGNDSIKMPRSGVGVEQRPFPPNAIDRQTLLRLGYFLVFLAYTSWRIAYPSYLLAEFQLNAVQFGLLVSIAGLSGCLAQAAVGLGRRVRIALLLLMAFEFMGGGMLVMSTSLNPGANALGALGVGVGFILFYPAVISFSLQTSSPGQTILDNGRLKSFGPLAAIIPAAAFAIYSSPQGYRMFLASMGLVLVAAGLVAFFHPGTVMRGYIPPRSTFPLNRALWPYYAINFLAGCRGAVFRTFALFAFMKTLGMDFQHTMLVAVAGSICSVVSYRLLGRLAAAFRPQITLSMVYLLVSGLYVIFFLSESLYLLVGLYCLDSLLFGVSSIGDSYLKFNTPPEKLFDHLSIGLALYYLAGVLFPVVGGILWEISGSKSTFLLGSILMLIAAAVSLRLRAFEYRT